MSDIASLGIKVDSSETVIAVKSLEQLAQISAEAEKAAEKLSGATKQQAKQLKELDKAAKANEATERRHIDASLERARAYTKIASAEVAAMQAAERNKSTVRQMAEEQKKLKDGLGKLLAAIDPLESRLNKLDEAEKKLHETFRAGVIEAEKYAETLAKIGAQRNEIVEKQLKEIGEGAGFASEMIKLLGLNSRESQRDLLNLGRAAASGNWSQMQSSMFQITRSSGALSLALSGVGLSIGAVTAGVGALGYMYYQSYRENQEFNRSLALTGNAAGATTEQLIAMSRSVGQSIAYAADTAKAVQDVARTGKVASDSIEEVALASVQMQQAFGQAVDQTISEFVRLGEAPSTALLELNDKYHHLTFSVYEQVRALEEQGREEEAMALAQRHHSEQLGIRAEEVVKHIGSIERAYLQAKKGVQDTWQAISDGIAGIGRQKTLIEQYEESAAVLRDLAGERQKLISTINTPFEPKREGDANLGLSSREMANRLSRSRDQATAQQQLKEVEAAIEVQQREHEYLALQKANEEQAAKVIADQRKNDQERIESLKFRDDYVARYSKLTRTEELDKANKEFEQATKTWDKNSKMFADAARAHQDRLDGINKSHDKSGRSGSGTNTFAAEAARLKARIAEETSLAAATEKTIAQVSRLNEFERRALQLRELAKNETKAINKAKLEELATLNGQAGALVRTNKLTEEAAKERLRYLEGIEKSTEKTREEAQKIRDQAQTMGMSKAAFEALTTARLQEQIAQLQGKEGMEEEVALLKEQLAARHELTAAIGEHDTARIAHETKKEIERDWQKTMDGIDDVFRKGFASMLNRGEGAWKSWTKSLSTTFKTAVADEIYKMFMKPFVAQVAVGVGGMLGMSGAANAQNAAMGFDVLRGANSAYSAFSGGMTSTLSNGIGYLGEMFGSSALSSFASGMSGAAVSSALASAAGSTVAAAGLTGVGGSLTIGSGVAASLGTSAATGSALSGMAGAGAMLGAAMPWITGGLAIAAMIPTISKMLEGETRVGGGFVYDPSLKQASFHSGPSGGHGGQQTVDAVTQLFGSTVDTINDVIKGVGAKAEIEFFHGAFESSEKGRGGTFSGGGLRLDDGSVVDFGGAKKGDGFGGKSGSAEEMFQNLQSEVHFAALEAWKAVGSEMPSMISDMLDAMDIRSLGAEQAQAAVAEITGIVGSVNALTVALHQLPMANLQELTFDAKASLNELFGGVDGFIGANTSYLQSFYSDAERHELAVKNLGASLAGVGIEMPTLTGSADELRAVWRELVETQDLETAAGREAYATLMLTAGAFSEIADYAGEAAAGLTDMTDILRERDGLERQIMQLQGDTAGLRALELAALDESNRGLQEHIWLLQEEAEAAQRAAEIGRERYGLETQLLQLQGDTATLRARQLAGLDASNHALQEQIWALQDQSSAAQEAAKTQKSFWDSLVSGAQTAYNDLSVAISAERSAIQKEADRIAKSLSLSISAASDSVRSLDSLASQLSSTVSGMMKSGLDDARNRAWAQERVSRALSVATLTGVMPEGEDFEAALRLVAEPSEGLFNSFEDYQADFLRTAHEVDALRLLADDQLTVERRTLKTLEDQLAQSQGWRDAEMLRLDAQLDHWREQIDIASGTYRATLSVSAAVNGVQRAIASLHKSLAPESSLASYDTGTSFVPHDMTANIHRGEIIIDPQSSNILRRYGIGVQGASGGSDSAEVKLLRQEIRELRGMLERKLTDIDQNTYDTARSNRQLSEQPQSVVVTNVVPTVNAVIGE